MKISKKLPNFVSKIKTQALNKFYFCSVLLILVRIHSADIIPRQFYFTINSGLTNFYQG